MDEAWLLRHGSWRHHRRCKEEVFGYRAGVDVRAAMWARRDQKGNIHVPVYDVKTKKPKFIRAGKLQTSVIAFPGQTMRGTVDALKDGVVRRVAASKVDYQLNGK